MTNTSTYKKNFFLPGETLSFHNLFETISVELKPAQKQIKDTETFSSPKKFNLTKNVVWKCSKCGHTHIGSNSPTSCPICNSSYEINE